MRSGESTRRISKNLGIHRTTVKRYRQWAEVQDLLVGELPAMEDLQQLAAETLAVPPPQNLSSVEPYRKIVVKLRRENVEVAAIHERLKERGYGGGYASVWRFVRKLEPQTPEAMVRVETKPGEETQVDFGYAGRMIDQQTEKLRKTWAFVMTLSWSRHQYVEFVFDQKVGTWLQCHRHAFEFFGGAPQRVVIDNLKAGIIRATRDDPQVQQAYGECAEHYGFLISPNRPRTPQHKGKVEQGGVHYVKRNFLGGREPTSLTQANQDVRRWCETTAGQRIHGTTKEQPLLRFREVEQAKLQPLPASPYDLAIWKQVKLHRDCHVVFENAYYSAPFRLIGQRLRVRGGAREVRIYTGDYELVATHPRAEKAGERHTNPAHLPAEKLAGLQMDREVCLTTATEIGPNVSQVVQDYLDDKVLERLPTVRRLLKLREKYGDVRLEAACQRAIHFDDADYRTIKRILVQGLEATDAPPAAIIAPAYTFVRSAIELFGQTLGGMSWN
jgi:transposase